MYVYGGVDNGIARDVALPEVGCKQHWELQTKQTILQFNSVSSQGA